MTIEVVKLRRFTAFKSLDFQPSPGVNVLVGANGTGKTHLMKVMYAACAVSKTRVGFAEKLVRVFMPFGDNIGRLVNHGDANTNCEICVSRPEGQLCTSFTNRTPKAASAPGQRRFALGGKSRRMRLHSGEGNARECARFPLPILATKYSL